ncbi:glycosyl transferase family 2 [Bacteroidia bacterium]|nr:glycosyl transferase family 2 [Bacteroidia bacterium]GHV46184.1 glycosyl transferase family 2 [Bacteroidia bacterium]
MQNQNKIDISFSVVAYKTPLVQLEGLVNSIKRTSLVYSIILVDNCPSKLLENKAKEWKITYLPSEKNLGYGRANNIAIRQMLKSNPSKYHVIINPDVVIADGTLEKLFEFMETNNDVGMTTTKVLYPDGEIQAQQRLLPTPMDLLGRRFGIRTRKSKARNAVFEMRHFDRTKIFECPFVLGCFMFIRTAVFEKVGLFDERFFLYLEDTDLSRRIFKEYKVLYYPEGEIIHEYHRDSYHSLKALRHHIASAFVYFNKWGWLNDKERDEINRRLINAEMEREKQNLTNKI